MSRRRLPRPRKFLRASGDPRPRRNANARRVQVVRQLSHNAPEADGRPRWPLVDVGRVPVRVHGVGVYYRRFFDPEADLARRIRGEHAFQSLTESTKPGTAHRTGIYLTPVRSEGDALHFRAHRTHAYVNLGSEPAVLLVAGRPRLAI